MFEKEKFIAYTGRSGNSYANGLVNIETTYHTSIDDEYALDECKGLLEQLSQDKARGDFSEQERKRRANWYSHLKKYVEYRVNSAAFEQRNLFVDWMQLQPRRGTPEYRYNIATVNGAAALLERGMSALGVKKYAHINCFTITNPVEFSQLYADCFTTATAYDKQHGHRDFRNGLDFYMQFLNHQCNTAVQPADAVRTAIRKVIAHYKDNFATVDEGERYKWEAIYWYKQHWNIDASDFAAMVEAAFGKAFNLLASGMYYPYRMLVEYAQADPEAVRKLFRTLHDERIPLAQRFESFRDGFALRIEQIKAADPDRDKALQHYQDLRAVMVYLTFEYPEKYYLYKATMYSTFCERTGYVELPATQKTSASKVESYFQLCELILEEVQADSELIAMSKTRLSENCYQDEALHLLVMDIVYYGSNYMETKDFATQLVEEIRYWPSKEEYDPGLTKEMWIAILQDVALTPPEMLDILQKMLTLGGESTCYRMAEVYGRHASYYNIMGSSFGRRIHKRLHLVDCYDCEDQTVRYYPIPFLGRRVVENGKTHYSWKLRDELKEALMSMDLSSVAAEPVKTDVGLNTILYGPPGTGKTYYTAYYAVAIIENKPLAEILKEERSDVLIRYNDYKDAGRIAFTAFHQSYGYEEFIEGIKPVVSSDEDSGDVQYSVQPGVFKRFCEIAQIPAAVTELDYGISDAPTVWKVSLAGTYENPVRTECLANGHIRIAWDELDLETAEKLPTPLNAFINRMQIGDIVFSCYSASTIDAIGVVTGDYEWHDEYSSYKRLRKVHWIATGIQEDIRSINSGKSMTLGTVYRLYIPLADVYRLIEKYQPSAEPSVASGSGNYVFVIDEINRGNISKILGELITLLEPTKRLGQEEGVTVTLPYSQTNFGVPANVYIIGTMNTADRSIATLDTALRRRFAFQEMLPDPSVLADVKVEDLSISNLLERINKRIAVLYDREHTIGHAYFTALRLEPTVEALGNIFRNTIIPLLQEYFYDDYEKIRLVLGDNTKDREYQFILATKNDYAALFGSTDIGLDESWNYELNNEAFQHIESYRSI